MTRPLIALLGRKDTPTDAVEEYCKYLGHSLNEHDFDLQIRRVPWEKHGWQDALHALELQAAGWKGTWVLIQYTALAWSARGFPLRFRKVLKILRRAGARVAIVFHDVLPFSSSRIIDQCRQQVQKRIMLQALNSADLAIFTVPPEKLSWVASIPNKAAFIPVGPNLPIPEIIDPAGLKEILTVGVFSITGGDSGSRETQTILEVVRDAIPRIGKIRLLVFGRHAELREQDLRCGLQALPVDLTVEGVLSDQEVVKRFRACDVMLFVRQAISSRRSSAIAGIACGVPMIAYSGEETAPPITDAGVLLVSPSSTQELKDGLFRLLSDAELRKQLATLNRSVYQDHFAWSAIAAKFAVLLNSR